MMDDFIEAVRLMRLMQKAYFKDRTQSQLAACKAQEKEVDRMLSAFEKAPEPEIWQTPLFE